MKLPFEVTEVFWMTVNIWDQYDTIVHQGGTSSSKTYSIMQWLILKAAEKKRRITVVGQDIPNLRAGALRDAEQIFDSAPECKEWIKGDTYNKALMTYFFKNGSFIEFKSYANSQDAKSGKRDIAFFNEVNGIDKGIYDEIADRAYEKVLMDFNPTAKFWVHTELLKDETTIRLISNFSHNQFCPKKVIKKLLRYKKLRPARWRVYGLGLTGIVEGIIYQHVNWIKESEWPGDHNLTRFGYAIDYGYSNDPLAKVKAGMYKGEVYAKGLIYKSGLRLTSLVKQMERLKVDYDDEIMMDDSQAKEQADLLRDDYGYNVKSANRRAGAINQGIDLLLDQTLNIVYDKHWQEEQDNYAWITKNGILTAKPKDKANHYWDALRYWGLEKLTEAEMEDWEQEVEII